MFVPNIKYGVLFSLIREEDVYFAYLGYTPIPKRLYISPFRDEKQPSFGTYFKGAALKWNDFGEDQRRRDVVGFVMHLFDIDYSDAMQKIVVDVLWGGPRSEVFLKPALKKSTAGVLVRSTWTTAEYRIWEVIATKKMIRRYNIYPVEASNFNGYEYGGSVDENPMFAYIFGPKSWKIYRPLSKNKLQKFRTYNISDVVEGYAQLPVWGDSCVHTSSLKDAVTTVSAGWNACNPPGEGSIFPIIKRQEEFASRFKNNYIVFDPDKTGIRYSKKLEARTSWKFKSLQIPGYLSHQFGVKDPYDIAKRFGLSAWKEILTAMIKQQI